VLQKAKRSAAKPAALRSEPTGQLVLQERAIPATNRYSYTYPDHPFINHHWGSGVILFLVHRVAGFEGLSLVFIGVSLATWWLFFHAAWRDSHFEMAACVSILLLPLLATRAEVRPEVFSYFFSGVFFWLLSSHREGRLHARWLLVLPLCELLWVNLHLYFVLGPALIAAFLFEGAVFCLARRPGARERTRHLGFVLLLTCLAAVVNPAGVRGAVYPLRIFHNYGYRVFENQPVWFIERLFSYPPALHFKIACVVLLLSVLFRLVVTLRTRTDPPLAHGFLAVVVSTLGWQAVRNLTLFGYFALPLACANVRSLRITKVGHARASWVVIPLLLAAFVGILRVPGGWGGRRPIRLGLQAGVTNAADFFRHEALQGPILNNYDIGSYLIYHLYPREQVFVDNRPEAYPATFFEQTYVPLQEDEQRWREADARYRFNVIFFSRHDVTPWGQAFLGRRVFDPGWVPVYVDEYAIILLRNDGPNQTTIRRYELPRSLFSMKPVQP